MKEERGKKKEEGHDEWQQQQQQQEHQAAENHRDGTGGENDSRGCMDQQHEKQGTHDSIEWEEVWTNSSSMRSKVKEQQQQHEEHEEHEEHDTRTKEAAA